MLLSHQGCPAEEHSEECRNPFETFQGCMRLLAVENQQVDLMMVQQRLLGNYSQLQIDMCGITDRSAPADSHLIELRLNRNCTLAVTDTETQRHQCRNP